MGACRPPVDDVAGGPSPIPSAQQTKKFWRNWVKLGPLERDEPVRLIISPAKKMREDTDSFPCHSLPRVFCPTTREILAALRAMSPAELQALWECSDRIAAQNVARLETMDLERRLTPAVMAYRGDPVPVPWPRGC